MQHRGTFVAYYRVSTQQLGQSGLGLEAQKRAVADYLNDGNWRLAAEFVEVETGKRSDRPELAKALAACRKQRAKLVIAKLDRLSRNLAFIAALMDSGVEFIAVDNPHANKLTVHILAAVAQHEREMIAERTKAALQVANARGVQLGNPRLSEATSRSQIARKAIADQHAANVVPMIREVQRAGANTLREIAEALNARGIPTPTRWQGGVQRTLSLLVARLDHQRRLDPQLVRQAIELRKQLRIGVPAEVIRTLLWLSIAADHVAQFPVAVLLAHKLEVRLPAFRIRDRLNQLALLPRELLKRFQLRDGLRVWLTVAL